MGLHKINVSKNTVNSKSTAFDHVKFEVKKLTIFFSLSLFKKLKQFEKESFVKWDCGGVIHHWVKCWKTKKAKKNWVNPRKYKTTAALHIVEAIRVKPASQSSTTAINSEQLSLVQQYCVRELTWTYTWKMKSCWRSDPRSSSSPRVGKRWKKTEAMGTKCIDEKKVFLCVAHPS